VASAWELSRSGLMVMATGALTAKGQRLAAEQRQRARTSWAGTAQAAWRGQASSSTRPASDGRARAPVVGWAR